MVQIWDNSQQKQEGSGMQKGKGEVLTNTQKKKALKYLMERIGTDWKRAETVIPDTVARWNKRRSPKRNWKEITAESETTTLERDNI